MGGQIFVSSQLGTGSTFCFTLPLDEMVTAVPEVEPVERTALLLSEPSETTTVMTNVLAEYGITCQVQPFDGQKEIVYTDYNYIFAHGKMLLRMRNYPINSFTVALSELDEAGIDELVEAGNVHEVLALPFSSLSMRACVERLNLGRSMGRRMLESKKPVQINRNSFENARVLVVDDSAVNREVVQQALSQFKISPVIVEGGFQAIEEFQKSEFDLVFMDCSMPDIDGFETTLRLRAYEDEKNKLATPIVALTAYIASQVAEQVKEATMDDLVVKPFTMESIGACLDKWLEPSHVNETVADEAMEPEQPDECVVELKPTNNQNLAADSAILDESLLSNLKEIAGDGYEAMINQLFSLYRENARANFEALENAVQSGVADQVQSAAHALKSMSLNIGARKVGEGCQQLEDFAKSKPVGDFKAGFAEVAVHFQALMNHIESEDLGNTNSNETATG